MDLNVDALLKEVGAQAAILAARNAFLAGQVGALTERIKALEAEKKEALRFENVHT